MRTVRTMVWMTVMLLGLVIWNHAAWAVNQTEQREVFVQAEEALRKGRTESFQKLLARLEGYPLRPYLLAQELKAGMRLARASEVRSFVARYDDSPVADSLLRDWLRMLGRQSRWADFLRDYRPQSSTELQCLHGRALLATGNTSRAMNEAERLWLSARSQPKSCDPLFHAWMQKKAPSPELVWKRIDLAIQAGETKLVRYLRRFLPAGQQSWLDFWLRVDEQPDLVLKQDWRKMPDDVAGKILAHGMRKLTRVDAAQAGAHWDGLKLAQGLTSERFPEIEQDIALFMSLRFEQGALERISALPLDLRGQRLSEWAVRTALRQQNWPEVLHMVDSLPAGEQLQPRWRYWRARALEQTGWEGEARAIYADLAREGLYFGMLAADRLGVEYAMPHAPVTASAADIERVKQHPGLQRAVELYALKRYGPGRSEWQRALQGLNSAQQLAAAKWAQEVGWHDRAITATVAASHYTDMDIRFPLAHTDTIFMQTQLKNLNPAWVLGVMRQESLFMADVGSSAGALGLMQIMPRTGRRIARWHGEKLSSSWLLLDPERNIRFGTSYLRRQLDELQDHYALASAAYNAGQHRVKGWLPREDDLPADIWVETIPFNETRKYVERVMAYTAIYEHRMGNEPTRLSARLRPVRPVNWQELAGGAS
jgi:soluble lytic murein transglycosylase